ncbi:MAG: amidase, partial [Gammaproteobacteria bacterium]|nr:amidase [Gammaproteobacteria bacterium]
YNAIISMVDDAELMHQAEQADRALDQGEYWGWMHGMPHAVKDLADARGLESSYGSRIFAGTIASEDNLPTARIRAQGAIFIGKTNVPEFGLGSQTYNEVHGTTRNAYDPNLIAGGSSGGAASGLAVQLLPTADGSDMMGSLRNPAAFNNVIGFRPSQGRVPSSSPQENLYYDQLATDGPMGRTVEDTIRLLKTMAGHDSRAPLSLRDTIPLYNEFRQSDLADLRIGWMGDYHGYLAMEPGVLKLCEAALEQLSEHGAGVETCMPRYDMARLWETWLSLRHWAMSGFNPLYDDPQMRKLLKPELVWEIEGSLNMPAARIAEAGINRSDWYRALHELFEHYDVLVLPSAQVFPFSADVHWPKSINGKTMDTYHRWMEVVIGGTLAGLPVISMPVGFDQHGRPMGIQFMGPMGCDRKVLEFAMAYESVTHYLNKRPMLREQL